MPHSLPGPTRPRLRMRARQIPVGSILQPSEYLPEEHLWVWMYEGNQMFMDVGEPVRCRRGSTN